MSDGQDTQVREPAEPRLYGLLPHVLVLVLGAAAIGAAAGFLIRGNAVLGSLLLGAGVIGLLLYVQEAIRRRASLLDGMVAGGYDWMRAFSGYANASLRMWSRAGGRVARLRFEATRLLQERRRAQLALGAAAYAGDETAAHEMIERMRSLDRQLAECAAQSVQAVEEAQSRLAKERLAISRTEIRRI